MNKREQALKVKIAALESELRAQEDIIRSYDERVMKMAEIQADYERRLEFFHAAVSSLTERNGVYIGTWDLPYALEQGIKMKVLSEYAAGDDLAELYSEWNGGLEVKINNWVVDMVYDRATCLLYEVFPNADAVISYTGQGGCWTDFYRCDDDDGELYTEFCEEVRKKRVEDPDEFERVEAILKVVFDDVGDKEMLDFLNKPVEISKQMS